MKQPDPTNHFWWSLIKSAMRIAGYAIMLYHLPLGLIILILAEVLGIKEELV